MVNSLSGSADRLAPGSTRLLFIIEISQATVQGADQPDLVLSLPDACDPNFGGRADAFLHLNTGKMGPWEGGGFHVHPEIMGPRYRQDRLHVGRKAGVVYRGDYTLPVGDRGFDLRFVQVQRVGPNIDEDEPGLAGIP